MNKFLMNTRRAATGKAVTASVVMLGLSLFAGGVAAAPGEAGCREETRKVAVWPKSPRAAQVAKFEERTYKVCDGKVVSRATREDAKPARGSSN
jgi:hypothetical protein